MAGNAVIGALRVNLGIDSAEFSSGLKQAQSSLAGFAKAAKIAFAAVAAAGAAALGALAVGIRNTLNEADDLSKLSAKIGIPVEELSKLKYAADLSGVSLDGLKTGVSKLAKNMADAAEGTGEGAKAFARLGISVTGTDGKLKSTSQVMAEISDKFAAMPDGAQKTALAMELMGRSGTDMIPMLNGGSAALNGLLAEAKALGLEISTGTAAAAEQFNDNLSRMGYAVSGLTIGITAALAPALAVASDAMVEVVKWIVGAVDYLPALAEYAAVAGGSLAIMLAPTLVAAAQSLVVAIGTGLVGAIKLLGAVILANPLGALVVAIAAAVTAIYYFRDEIQKALGVDVVQIAKDAANFIINSFVAAYEDIRLAWSKMPAALGDLVYSTANAVIAGVEAMVNAVTTRIDAFIAKINTAMKSLPFGVGDSINIGSIGEVSFGRIDNPFAGAGKDYLASREAMLKDVFSRSPIDAVGKAFSGATPGVQEFGAALGGVNDQLGDIGGGGGGGKKGKDGSAKKAADGIDKMAQSMDRAKESLGQGFGSILEGLVSKTLSWKDALVQAGQAILKYLNQISLAQGSKGLFGGGFIQGLFGSLLGFAGGGSFRVGGSGGVDSQLVAFKASPNERVSISRPGDETGGRSVFAPTYNIDARGADQAAIARLERALAERDRNFGKMVDKRVDTRQMRRTRG